LDIEFFKLKKEQYQKNIALDYTFVNKYKNNPEDLELFFYYEKLYGVSM